MERGRRSEQPENGSAQLGRNENGEGSSQLMRAWRRLLEGRGRNRNWAALLTLERLNGDCRGCDCRNGWACCCWRVDVGVSPTTTR